MPRRNTTGPGKTKEVLEEVEEGKGKPLTKAEQIRAIEKKKRDEAHQKEQEKIDAIEAKIQNARKRIEDKKKEKS